MQRNRNAVNWVAVLFVAVATTSAFSEPGDGIRVGDMLLHPYVDAAVSYDSNPLLFGKGQEADDVFLDFSPGLNITKISDLLRLDALLWSRFRRYDEFNSENRDDLSEEVRLVLGRLEDWRLRLNERYGRVSDYDVVGVTAADIENQAVTPLSMDDRSQRVNRHILDAGFGVEGPLTDKMSMDGLFDYGKVNYTTPGLLDSVEERVSVKFARKVTTKSSAILAGDYIRMDNDSLPRPANYYAGRAGWQWQGTDKSRFEGSIGAYDFSGADQNDGGAGNRGGFSYNMAWYWRTTSKLLVTIDGRNEMQLAVDAPQNAKLSSLVTGSARYALTERTAFALLLGYRNDGYDATEHALGGELVKRKVVQLHYGLRVDHQLLKWLKVYGEAWREDTQDNVRGDYDEMRATLGLKAEY